MDKCIIFSDMHFGIDGNSQIRLEDARNCCEWIGKVAEDQKIKIGIFAGDWFHNRDEIDVRSAVFAKRTLEDLALHFSSLYMIAGNHDYYYNNSGEISSISLLDGVNNVTIVDKEPLKINLNGKSILLTPWFFDPSKYDENRNDVMIGHFEFIGGKMNGSYSRSGHDPKSMLKVAPLVFTGHYHLTNEVEKEDGKIITIGSPYQQDWGDYNDNKRILIFDGNEYQSVYNTSSPSFLKIPFSKISAFDDEKLKKLFSNGIFDNSYVKIVSDDAIDFDKYNRIINIASSGGMRKIEIDSVRYEKLLSESIEENLNDLSSKNLKSYVLKFVEENAKLDSSLDVEKLKELAEHYFGRIEGAVSI